MKLRALTLAVFAFISPIVPSLAGQLDGEEVLRQSLPVLEETMNSGYSSTQAMQRSWQSPDIKLSDSLWGMFFVRITSKSIHGRVRLDLLEHGSKRIASTVFSTERYGAIDEQLAFEKIENGHYSISAHWEPGVVDEKISFSISDVLTGRDFRSQALPKLSVGGIEAGVQEVESDRLMRLLVGPLRRQSALRKSSNSWFPLPSGQVPSYLSDRAPSVVKLGRRAPQCYWDELDDDKSKLEVDRSTLGCTAFRVGKSTFATAWHCLPDNKNGGCKNVDIKFGYDGKGYNFSERCETIVYRNRNLDVVIFQASATHSTRWKEVPILKFSGNAFPFVGEPLAILHYPAPAGCPGLDPASTATGGFNQLGLQVSRFSKDAQSGLCKAFGSPSLSNAATKYPMEPPKDAKSVCDERPRPTNADLTIGYGCATCEGSSGAPVLSMSADPKREGRVVGVHINGQRGSLPNRAVRSTAIADCIDVDSLESDHIRPGRSTKASYCLCKAADDLCLGTN